jgi:NADPH:quinone reductase-like Zn-dependent oxidoreductase
MRIKQSGLILSLSKDEATESTHCWQAGGMNGMDEEALALWMVAPGQAAIRPARARAPRPGTIRVRALVSGISRGTESLVFRGLVPKSEWKRMRCPFQEGEFSFPVKYGYAIVGVIEEGSDSRVGQRVFCLHPHQTRFTVPPLVAYPLPEGLPTERAVLAPQMETALNACWDGSPRVGDRIAVVGAGVIGCLVAYLAARLPGTSVTLIDREPSRAAVAATLGAGFALPNGELPQNCDLVFHASGEAEGLDLALSLAGFETTVIELSWYGSKAVPAHLGGAFHSQRLTLRSSQVGSVAPDRRQRWDPPRRMELAISLLADARLDALISGETPFEELPAALPQILGQPGPLCHLVRYSSH